MQDLQLPPLRYSHMNDALAEVTAELVSIDSVKGLLLYGPVSYLRQYPDSTHLWLLCYDDRPELGLEVWQKSCCRVHVNHTSGSRIHEQILQSPVDRPPYATASTLLDRDGLVGELVASHRAAFERGPSPLTDSQTAHARSSISWKIWQAEGLSDSLGGLRAYLAPTLLELFRFCLIQRKIWPLHMWDLILALPEVAPDLSATFEAIMDLPDGQDAWHAAMRLCEDQLACAGGLTKAGDHFVGI